MKRYVREGGEVTNAKLTDEMIEKANAIVDKEMYKKESADRYCHIWGKYFPEMFSIECETDTDYQVFKFKITNDGDIKYFGREGNWKD